jgi:hypothetical protein
MKNLIMALQMLLQSAHAKKSMTLATQQTILL